MIHDYFHYFPFIVFGMGTLILILIIWGFSNSLRMTPKPEKSDYSGLPPLEFDPADDGPEVRIIRAFLAQKAGEKVYHRDPATKRVLPYPMTLVEIMDHFGCERG